MVAYRTPLKCIRYILLVSLVVTFKLGCSTNAAVMRYRLVRESHMPVARLTIVFAPTGEEHEWRLNPVMYDSTSESGFGAQARLTVQV